MKKELLNIVPIIIFTYIVLIIAMNFISFITLKIGEGTLTTTNLVNKGFAECEFYSGWTDISFRYVNICLNENMSVEQAEKCRKEFPYDACSNAKLKFRFNPLYILK